MPRLAVPFPAVRSGSPGELERTPGGDSGVDVGGCAGAGLCRCLVAEEFGKAVFRLSHRRKTVRSPPLAGLAGVAEGLEGPFPPANGVRPAPFDHG